MMWEVWSNEDPGNQVRTTELSELSPFQRFSMLTLSGHGEYDFAGHEVYPFLFCSIEGVSILTGQITH